MRFPPETLTGVEPAAPPDRIVIVGGTAVVSAGVEASLWLCRLRQPWLGSPERTVIPTAAALSASDVPEYRVVPAAHVESEDLPNGDGINLALMSVAIVAPAARILLIDAGADFFVGPDAAMKCWVEIGTFGLFFIWFGNTIPEFGAFFRTRRTTNSEEDCSTGVGINVAAGTHTLRFYTDAATGVTILDGAMTVLSGAIRSRRRSPRSVPSSPNQAGIL